MARAIWDGTISFGLINVGVKLYSLEKRSDIKFHLIDASTKSRVRYIRVSEETGEEVPWNHIVKGYEYEDGQYVLLGDEELEHIRAEATKSIELEDFVKFSEIPPVLFDQAYLLVPDKKSEKSYALLREVLKNQQKVGVGKVVIRTREHLAAVTAKDEALILNLLRFPQEIKKIDEFDVPVDDLRSLKISNKEVKLAEELVNSLTSKWSPRKYHDEHREALQEWIDKKISEHETEVIEPEDVEVGEPAAQGNVIDFATLLEKSLKANRRGQKKKTKSSRAKPKRKAKKHVERRHASAH